MLWHRYFLIVCFLWSVKTTAQQPFTCEDQFFLTLSAGLPSLNEVVIDPQTKSTFFRTINSNIGVDINAIGYRVTDNYIYGINPNTRDLLRVDATGNVVILATLPLNQSNVYFAGDVTSDGRYLVLLGSNTLPTTGNNITTDIVKVDLTSPAYPITSVQVNRISMIFDIAFHPVTDQLYGYDGSTQRLVLIDPDQGVLDYPFPTANVPFITGSLFFDAYGNLFAYGANSFFSDQNSLYLINTETGRSTFLAAGAVAEASDGCSCPYTIELSKAVEPRRVLSCQDVEYTFTITNASRRPHIDIVLSDELPNGFTFVSLVKNEIGGTLASVPGDTRFRLENVDLQLGEFEVVIRVNTGNVPPGTYKNQGQLLNIPASLGSVRRSDDLSTIIIDDSTALEVIGLPIDTLTQFATLCAGDGPLTLNAGQYVVGLPPGFSYSWSTNDTQSELVIDVPGTYSVTINSGCDSATVTYIVGASAISTEIITDNDQEINLGDRIGLEGVVKNDGSQTIINWIDPQAGSLSCIDCLTPSAKPFNDIVYILTAQNEFGCTASDSLLVRVKKNRDIYFPNAFAPGSGASENAYFYASGDPFTQLQVVEVFSRWGELLYRRENVPINDIGSGWDGKHKNRDMNPGVYTWRALVKYLDGFTQEWYGDVTLVR